MCNNDSGTMLKRSLLIVAFCIGFLSCGGSPARETQATPSQNTTPATINSNTADPITAPDKGNSVITIYNAIGINKLAGKVTDWLGKKGFTEVKAENWNGSAPTRTYIFYEKGSEETARRVAVVLSVTEMRLRKDGDPAALVGVVLGPDFDDLNLFANPALPSGDMSVLDQHSAPTEETAAPKGESNPDGIYISLSKCVLSYYEKGFLKGSWKCAVGAADSPTPTGSYKVTSKAVKPDWSWRGKTIPPGPKNGLGVRFLGISKPSYGIHGTNDPESIGRAVSHGCVRMNNRDIITVYELVKVGTPVTIVE